MGDELDILTTVKIGSQEWRDLLRDIDQGTEGWRRARCGMVTASRIGDVLARTASGDYGAGRKNYMAELMVERMTGIPTDGFTSREMQWGTDHEPDARFQYEMRFASVETVGLIVHPRFDFSAGSPDGLVGTDGGIEIKCPNTATHIETFTTRKVPEKYRAQCQWNMACTGRAWWDFVSYDPRMRDDRLSFCRIRIARDDKWIADTEREVGQFDADIHTHLAALIAAAEKYADDDV